MAAILGEPLPPGSAEAADVAVLRERLGVLGRVLSEPSPPREPAPAPAALRPRPRPRRHRRNLALGALAVACAGAFLSGMAWLVTQAGGGGAEDAGASSAQADAGAKGPVVPFGSPAYLACARLVAEGTVTGSGPAPGEAGRRITVEITRQYAPEKASREVTFLTGKGTGAPGVGDRVLFGLPAHGVHPDALFVGEAEIAPERARVTAALPEARTLTCD
ncbi:hypothetical protein J7I94_15505 [Streptomyces sp. ISL-12]|nr:hypothetical protein [Streptomyces sp. ISL-12]